MADASTDMEYEVKNFAESIDWALLKEQKQFLLDEVTTRTDSETVETIDGLLNFLDAIQDFFADNVGLGEDTVFPDMVARSKTECDICGVENTNDYCTNCSD